MTTTPTAIRSDLLLLSDDTEFRDLRRARSEDFMARLDALMAFCRDDYEQVATIDGNRNRVWLTAQNIDGFWHLEGHRSVSVGDLVREHYADGSHTLFLCCSMGWMELI